jgi:hypothetical protein
MESMESHNAGFPPLPHSLEIPSACADTSASIQFAILLVGDVAVAGFPPLSGHVL